MSKQSSRSEPGAADDLAVHLTEFIATVARAGYADKTRHNKERLIQYLIRWGRETGMTVADVDEDCVEVFLAFPSGRRQIYLHADMRAKEHTLGHADPSGDAPARLRPSDSLLALFQSL